MRQGIDNFILAYIVLRIRAGLEHIITRRARSLGALRNQIREQWPPIARLLASIAEILREGREVNWPVAEAVGLTEGMLDLKREAIDLTLGRRISTPRFLAGLNRAKQTEIAGWFSPKKIDPTETESRGASTISFTKLAADILDSILKILGVDDKYHAIKEFIAVIEAALKLNRGVFR